MAARATQRKERRVDGAAPAKGAKSAAKRPSMKAAAARPEGAKSPAKKASVKKTAANKATAKKIPAKKAQTKKAASGTMATGAGPEDRVARLEQELAAARRRIAELEAMHEDAVNRIDWVIDSLQTLLSEHTKG